MTFNELGLTEPIVRAVTAEGYTTPTPIQSKAIPEILAGHDVLGCAQTGTGKTAAFALPILHRLVDPELGKRDPRGRPRVLVLAPTRELATQIFESFGAYARGLNLRGCVVFGGVSQVRQVRTLRAGIDVLVATPGRLLDLIGQGHIDLSAVETLVLDEADRMLDMGFINDIRKVVGMMPERRQTLFFSATMPDAIRRLADSILNDPVFVQSAPVASTAAAITQSVYMVTRKNKAVLLDRLLHSHEMGRTLVFTRTKYGADKLVKVLSRSGIRADAIHGNKSQNARTRALAAFKSGRVNVLVATDIASRGIDVENVTHVINFDVPHEADSYVHRIGRTARAGASGVAMTFCDHDELNDLRAIERLTRTSLTIARDEPELLFEAPAAAPRKPRTRKPNTNKPRPAAHTRRRDSERSHSGKRRATRAPRRDRAKSAARG